MSRSRVVHPAASRGPGVPDFRICRFALSHWILTVITKSGRPAPPVPGSSRTSRARRRRAGWKRSTGTRRGRRSGTGCTAGWAAARLPQGPGPAVDVAADVVRVVALHVDGGPDRSARTRSWNPGANRSICASIGRIRRGESRGNMAVRPEGVLPAGRAGRVEQGRLGEQAVGALGLPARVHFGLTASHLGQGSRRDARCPPAGMPGPATARVRSARVRSCTCPPRT